MLLRIAIVDDLPQDAERLQQALTAEGQTNIIRYESGDALLSAISPEQLDALFLDICMEGTNGIDTARKLADAADCFRHILEGVRLAIFPGASVRLSAQTVRASAHSSAAG